MDSCIKDEQQDAAQVSDASQFRTYAMHQIKCIHFSHASIDRGRTVI